MEAKYEADGSGIACDGRCFDPVIPAGASVSWKRMDEAIFIPDQDRTATHILAVWDRFADMGVDADSLRGTPRGPCVAYYADAESIEDLVESAVPAPVWLDPEVPLELTLSERVADSHDEYVATRPPASDSSPEAEMHWLQTAVLTNRMLTNTWPILGIHIPPSVGQASLSLDKIRHEADHLFELIRREFAQQMESRWWEDRVPGPA